MEDSTLPNVGAKLQKMGVLYTHSPKRPSPFFKLSKNNLNNLKKGPETNRAKAVPRPTGDYWSLAGAGPPTGNQRLLVVGLSVTNDWWLVIRP
jgi:hypothetical protein